MVVRRCCGFVILMVLFLYRMVRGRGGGGLGIEKYEILCIFIFFIIDYDKCKYYDL